VSATAVIQVRLIVGGGKYFPDLGSAFIAGYKDGWSHIDSIVPAGLDWRTVASDDDNQLLYPTEGWLYGARMDTLPVYGIPRGVQLRPPGYTTFHRCGILTIPVTDRQWMDFWGAQRAKLGRPYDWRAILAFLNGGRNWHEPDSWICSEAVEDSLETAKILSPFWLAPYKISPGMVAARIEVLPHVWFTEIKQGTDPHQEPAIALEDWRYHCGAVPGKGAP